MKKLLVMLLALMLACGGVLAGAVAEEESPYQYTLRSDGTAEITCTDKSITCAKVPAELDAFLFRIQSSGRREIHPPVVLVVQDERRQRLSGQFVTSAKVVLLGL